MVSWGDGEESSTDVCSDTSMNTLYDSEYCGLADDGDEPVLCRCGYVAAKFVGFEGSNTGRRFLACEGQEGEKCDFLKWVDPVPSDAMIKALAKLWEMYAETKQGRVTDALDFMDQRFRFQDQIEKLHIDLRNSQDELAKVVEEKQVTLAHKAIAEQALVDARAQLEEKRITDETTCKMHRCLLKKAEKDKDKCKEEKRKLENYISDLLVKKEDLRSRFKKIKDLCDV